MPSFEDTIGALAAHQRLKPRQMQQLSGLGSEQLRQMSGVWSSMADPERMNLLAGLKRHAEDNALADYDAIYGLAMDDANADVRRVAVSAIADNQSLSLLERLLEMCSSDPEEMVRAATAERLGGFACEAEVGTFPEETARQIESVLVDRVRSETEALNVRCQALASAGYFSTEEVRNEVHKALPRAGLRIAAIRAIGHNLAPEWTPVLAEQMASEDPGIRREAAEAAAAYEDAVDALSDMVDDPVISVQLAAISSLGKIGGAEAKDILIFCFESEDPVIKKAATAALREMESVEDPLASAGPEWDKEEDEEDEESV
jgi:HEAT repeat protein